MVGVESRAKVFRSSPELNALSIRNCCKALSSLTKYGQGFIRFFKWIKSQGEKYIKLIVESVSYSTSDCTYQEIFGVIHLHEINNTVIDEYLQTLIAAIPDRLVGHQYAKAGRT